MTTRTDATDEFLVKAGRFFTPGKVSGTCARLPGRVVEKVTSSSRPLESRQGGAFDPRRELHGLMLLEGLRQDGVITWGVPADRLPDGRSGLPEYEPRGCRGVPRSPGTPTRRPASGTPTSGRFCSRPTGWPRPSTRTRSTPGPRSSVTKTRTAYQRARGKGGLVRSSWPEVNEMIAAAHVHTAKAHGPDRIFGFSPIPAMSMASHAAGSRFISLMGGAMLSFYDWYCDLPVASRRSSVTRPTCPSRRTGGTRAT